MYCAFTLFNSFISIRFIASAINQSNQNSSKFSIANGAISIHPQPNLCDALHTHTQNEWLKDTQKLNKHENRSKPNWLRDSMVNFPTLTMEHSSLELKIPHSNFLFKRNEWIHFDWHLHPMAFQWLVIIHTLTHAHLFTGGESEFYLRTNEEKKTQMKNYWIICKKNFIGF